MTDQPTQYSAATTSITLFDLTDRAQIEICGADRLSFLHNFCTNDINKLHPGKGCEAFLTDIKGRILGHLIVSADEESLWIDSVPGSADFIVPHLDKYLITEDATIADRSAERGPLCLIGPKSIDWFAEQGGNVADLPLWGQRSMSLFGQQVIVRHVGFTQPLAFEIVATHEQRTTLWDAIIATGVTAGAAETFDVLRIEAGFPHYGIDLTNANIAQEAARNTQAISFSKGCYLGQEPIARLDALGHTNKELRLLKLASGDVPAPGTVVKSTNGDDVGIVTSSAKSPAHGTVALAMLKSRAMIEGTEVRVGESTAITKMPLNTQM